MYLHISTLNKCSRCQLRSKRTCLRAAHFTWRRPKTLLQWTLRWEGVWSWGWSLLPNSFGKRWMCCWYSRSNWSAISKKCNQWRLSASKYILLREVVPFLRVRGSPLVKLLLTPTIQMGRGACIPMEGHFCSPHRGIHMFMPFLRVLISLLLTPTGSHNGKGSIAGSPYLCSHGLVTLS